MSSPQVTKWTIRGNAHCSAHWEALSSPLFFKVTPWMWLYYCCHSFLACLLHWAMQQTILHGSLISACLQGEALTTIFPCHLFQEVCIVNGLGKQRQCLFQGKNWACLSSIIEDLGFVSSRFLFYNATYHVCTCHLALFTLLYRNWKSGNCCKTSKQTKPKHCHPGYCYCAQLESSWSLSLHLLAAIQLWQDNLFLTSWPVISLAWTFSLSSFNWSMGYSYGDMWRGWDRHWCNHDGWQRGLGSLLIQLPYASCSNHFSLTTDYVWAYLTSWLGGSNRT